MSKSIKALLAAAVVGLFAWGCEKYDDTALNKKIDGLDTRVTALEKAVQDLNNTTIPGLKSLIEALQKQVSISSVTPTADGYVISFSDGTKATLTNGKDGKDGANGKDGKDGANGADGKDGKDGANGTDGKDGKDGADGQTPVIGVQLVDGVYCWTVNGVLLLDGNQKPIPVTGANGKDGQDGKDGANGKDGQDGKDGANGKDGQDGKDGATPQFRITDGVWEVSVDGGTTWAAVPVTGSVPEYVIITEEEDAYVFTFADESTIVIPKEQVFCLVITPQQETTDIYNGETLKFDYVVKGASAEDELLVDILNITPNYWDFEQSKVVPDEADATKGVIEITSQTWNDGVQYKIFIHAANGKGKTDTKVIVLTSKVFDAVFDVALETAAGGEYAFEVKSNDPFTVVTTVDWITAAETKANYEWTGTITIAPNETNVYRDGFVRVIYNDWGGVAKEFYVLQEPAGDKATSISYIKNSFEDGKEGVKANHLTVIAAGEKGALVTDGSEYMVVVLKEGQTALESGKVYDFCGTVTATEFGEHADWWSDVALTEAVATVVEGVDPVEVEFLSKYTYFGESWYRFNTTILYGKLEKEEDTYVISRPDFGYRGKNYILVDPAASLKLDELVGKNVFVKAWLLSSAWADGEPDTFTLLPIEAKAFELKEATTSLEFSFDKYYEAKLTPAEGTYFRYQFLPIADPEAEDAYATMEDIESLYNSDIMNMLYSVPSYETIEDFLKAYYYDTEEVSFDVSATYYQIDPDFDWSSWDGNPDNLPIIPLTYPVGSEFNVLAWVWDKNGPTGEYILKTFTREAVPYENYLGYWKTNAGVWKVAEKKAGETFKVTGVFSDYNAELEFTYDENNGLMMIPAQDMYSPTWYNDEYGYLARVLDAYYYPRKSYEEHLGEDVAQLFVNKRNNLEFKAIDAYEGYENRLQISAYVVSNGNYVGTFNTAWIYDSPRIDPSEAYLAWGGNWKLGDTVITITPEENSDIYYTVTGLHPKQNVTLSAQFDMETNNVIIYGYQYAQGESEYTKDGHKYHYYAVAKTADGGLWVTGDKLVTLVMDEEGKVEVQPGTYQTDEMDEPAEYSAFGLAGLFAPTDVWDWESDNAVWYNLPATLEKSDTAPAGIMKYDKIEPQSAPAATKPAKIERMMTLKEFRARLAK